MQVQKKILLFSAFLMFNLSSWAAIPSTSKNETVVVAKNAQKVAQLKHFVGLTTKDYEKAYGKKLNFIEKAAFKISQKRAKKMLKVYASGNEPTTLLKISWLLKGLLFGPIALLVGYLFLKDEERELIKWIWYGFAGFLAIGVLVLLLI